MVGIFVPLREMKASKGKVISDKDLEILLDRSDLLGEETCNQQNKLLQGNTGLTTIQLHNTISIINKWNLLKTAHLKKKKK